SLAQPGARRATLAARPSKPCGVRKLVRRPDLACFAARSYLRTPQAAACDRRAVSGEADRPGAGSDPALAPRVRRQVREARGWAGLPFCLTQIRRRRARRGEGLVPASAILFVRSASCKTRPGCSS